MNFKFHFFSLILFFTMKGPCAFGAQLQQPNNFSVACETRQARVTVWSEEDNVLMRFRNPEGFENFPLFEGVVTSRNLFLLKNALEDLKIFKSDITVRWQRDQCERDLSRPFLLACRGQGKILEPLVNGVETYTLSTQVDKQEILASSFETVKFNWVVSVNGRHHFITFPFAKETCWTR